ncbi:mechanosensitive ion channel family protein [Rhizobium sp. CG4]|uniref:mechanosensitive ion channel family protein n=1 Tax=Rhizobium sp. CG4 TaxID=2726075 RepID=UPI0020334619|nr:mechanosensitive ion channel domain-containing protein [Rhizobium sp. CG4]MCM2457516.1 mechanosensitive ion channel family protein [Rhizobium sp. CG4]
MAWRLNFLLIKLFLTAAALAVTTLAWMSAAAAQAHAPLAEQPASVQRFIGLMSDPDVQKWLQGVARETETATVPATASQDPASSFAGSTMRFRAHAASMVAAAHSFPSEAIRGAALLEQDVKAIGGTRPIVLLAAFVAAGLGAQWLFWRFSAGWRSWMAGASVTSVWHRVVVITARLLWAVCYVLSFGLGSIGFFLLFDWPPIIREIVVGFLFAVVIYRLACALLDVFLAPRSNEQGRFRVVPITNEAAGHWAKRISYLIGWYAFGWVTIRLLGTLGLSIPSRQLAAYFLGFILLGIAIEAIWRRPPGSPTQQTSRIGLHGRNWLWTAYLTGIWLLWVAGAVELFWVMVVCAALPGAIVLTKASINNILRRSETDEDGRSRVTVLSVIVERGIRATLIVAAIVFLANILDVRLTQMTMQDSPALRLVRGVLSAGIILLVVDLAWNVVKVLIDRKMGDTEAALEIGSERERRRTRLRTLLPILRNFLMILFAAIAIMMALSSLGIEIGPLIAGAGVVGVAIGFGAQTVVKDIISGMFYLLDDAFRIGEYIQSGSYKGTVEAFSLRSVKLRHHRGPIFIVPFSELGAIQNMSRDWSVVKFLLSVSYESDVAQVKAITKSVGKALREDPEFQPFIIENLKMKGVEEISDYGIKLSFGMTLKPTQLQSAIRRRAYAMLREAFNAQGIKIAVPTVQVAGGKEDGLAAVAQQALAKQTVVDAPGPT